MKKVIGACLALWLVTGLSACGCDEVGNVDLVFINDSGTPISHVETESEGRSGGVQNADSSPLKRGETFGFEVEQYPLTLTAYGISGGKEVKLGRIVVTAAPPAGERWYVTARDRQGTALSLAVSTDWPR